MSRIRSTSQLKLEGFQKQQWIAPVLNQMNKLLEEVSKIVNDGILFGDNVAGLQHVFDFTFESQAVTFPRKIQWPTNILIKPVSLVVISATEDDSPIMVNAAWEYTSDRLVQLVALYKVDTSAVNISDLTNGARYKIGVRVQP